ncbi:hypothetical protein N9251_00985 [Gammaproteobacteria bacterium]|nr:hypothetical protein [Gammaproteobacteria bacterium]
MKRSKTNFGSLLQAGLDLTSKRLIDHKIKNNEDLIFGNNGKVERIKADEFLASL